MKRQDGQVQKEGMRDEGEGMNKQRVGLIFIPQPFSLIPFWHPAYPVSYLVYPVNSSTRDI